MSQINSGLMMTLVFLALILLRPVLVPLLRPRHRVVLWSVGFLIAYLRKGGELLCYIPALPVTFLSLLSPVLPMDQEVSLMPQFFAHTQELGPEGWESVYSLALPGLAPLYFPVEIEHMLLLILIAGAVLFFVWVVWSNRRIKLLAKSGTPAPSPLKNVEVRMYDDLSTNFVCYYPGSSSRFLICLQKELSPEYLPLVLLHEQAHIRMSHLWYKTVLLLALLFFWWNPVYWLACRLVCQDIELACDEAVMDSLDDKGRRNYARALVELGSGQHMWGAVSSFGECDAALRVKRAAAWTPRSKLRDGLSLAGTALLIAFFYLGAWH